MIGFSSGLPLYILINLLPVWFRVYHLDVKSISLFAATQIPYTLKFLWAPFLDDFVPNKEGNRFHKTVALLFSFGRRRSWMLLSQILLIILVLSFAHLTPSTDAMLIAFICFLFSFVSATQDIVIDAYRREILADNELGLGNSIFTNAYRLSAYIPGGLSLIMVGFSSWATIFYVNAIFMIPAIVTTLLIKEPTGYIPKKKSLKEIVSAPFFEFFQRQGVKQACYVILFFFLYKLGDSMATALSSVFYIDIGYKPEDIGYIAKHSQVIPNIIGAFIGGVLMLKIGINKALWLFGFVQLASILGFAWLSLHFIETSTSANDLIRLSAVISFEYLGVGLGTAAFVAFLANKTNPLYAGTQLALFTSITSMPRTLINSFTGYMVDYLGWTHFFILCFIMGIPGMVMLFKVAPWKKSKK